MILDYPRRLIAVAILLLLFGFISPFLMVIKVIESTLFMNFFSFGASVLGLFLGIAGIASLRLKSHKNDDEESRYR